MKSQKRNTTDEANNPARKKEIGRSGDHYSNRKKILSTEITKRKYKKVTLNII